MAKESAGILLFRRTGPGLEFFLVHPGGPFFRNKDEGVWTIPKGELKADEDPLEAARREFEEETGHQANGDFIKLTPVKQKGGKTVIAFAVEGDCKTMIASNTFSVEWPPRSGKKQEFPEVDRAEWFSPEEAVQKLREGQRPLLTELAALVGPRDQ